MNGKETKHLKDFVLARLKSEERVEHHLEGRIGETLFGPEAIRPGQLILTTERVCFHTKGHKKFLEFQVSDIRHVEHSGTFIQRVRIEDDQTSIFFSTGETGTSVFVNKLKNMRDDCLALTAAPETEIETTTIGKAGIEALTKACPDCAELVKIEARICRFCRHDFVDKTRLVPRPARPMDADDAIARALFIFHNAVRSEGMKRAKIHESDLRDAAVALGLHFTDVRARAVSLGFRLKWGRKSSPVKFPPARPATRSPLRGGGSGIAVVFPIDTSDGGSHGGGDDSGGGD